MNSSFALKTKDFGKKTVLAMYEGPMLYVYFGDGAPTYFSSTDGGELDRVREIAASARDLA